MKSSSFIDNIKSTISHYHSQINFIPGNQKHPSTCFNGNPIKWSVMRWVNQYKQPFEKETMLKRVAKKRNVSVPYLEQEWDWKSYFSAFWGDLAHNELEYFFLQNSFRLINNENVFKDKIKQFVAHSLTKYDLFFKNKKEKELLTESIIKYKNYLFKVIPILAKNLLETYNIIDTEITIVNPQICGGISGIIDVLVQDKQTKKIGILDFKTNKKFNKVSDKHFNKLLPPFHKFPECEHTIYSLQLLAYQGILKESYQIDASFLKNIWISANALTTFDQEEQKNTDMKTYPYLIIDSFDDKEFIEIFKSEFYSGNKEIENINFYLEFDELGT